MSAHPIELTGVGKDYRYFSLQDVNLVVPDGQIMGFIGPNGAGKSTTIRILLGLVHQDRGLVRVCGRSMPTEQAAAKWDVGFASEDMRLYEQATLDWHMRFVRAIYPGWDEAYATTLLTRFDLRREQAIKGLSHGQRVKATLLLVLARRPRVLVLDEPTTGLDPVARHEVLRELSEVMRDDCRSVLFSSHNTHDIEQICDQITFIDRGRILECRDKEAFLERWRRLRIELPAGIALPHFPTVVDTRQTGRLAVAITNAFDDELPRAYETAGLRVQSVEQMTLEEIFVTNVHARREGAAV
jgi:ABC-2 type transport system ATP-binding protein